MCSLTNVNRERRAFRAFPSSGFYGLSEMGPEFGTKQRQSSSQGFPEILSSSRHPSMTVLDMVHFKLSQHAALQIQTLSSIDSGVIYSLIY